MPRKPRKSLAEKLVPDEYLIEVVNGYRIGYGPQQRVLRIVEEKPGSQLGYWKDILWLPKELAGEGYEGALERLRQEAKSRGRADG